jgi:hypothetical protein
MLIPRSLALPGNAHRRLCLHYIHCIWGRASNSHSQPESGNEFRINRMWFFPRSLALPGNAHRRLCLHYIHCIWGRASNSHSQPESGNEFRINRMWFFPRSLALLGNAHGRLCMTTIIFCQNQDVQDLRINRMFDNGWVDEFLGMFDICFSMILLITWLYMATQISTII